MIRVDGDIRRINVPPLEHKTVHDLVYDIMNDKQRKDYEEFLETARNQTKYLLARDPELATDQGRAARLCLYLFEKDEAVRMLSAG